MTKPLLYVDIDGVLNIFALPEDKWEDAHHFYGREGFYSLVLDRRHPGWLRHLGDYYDLVWATMWQGAAQTEFAPKFGWGHDTPWVSFAHGYGRGVGEIKSGPLRKHAQGRRAYWLDDDITPRVQSLLPDNITGIPIDPKEGFTESHYRFLLAEAELPAFV